MRSCAAALHCLAGISAGALFSAAAGPQLWWAVTISAPSTPTVENEKPMTKNKPEIEMPTARHRSVERQLRPSCTCHRLAECRTTNHAHDCSWKNWTHPPEIPWTQDLKNLDDYKKEYDRLEHAWLKLPSKELTPESLQELVLKQEGLLKALALKIMAMEGQPNSFDNYMYVDMEFMDEVRRMYENGPPPPRKRPKSFNNASSYFPA